ncbi:2-succinyl-5-enolpyruvyl-6-hydroxy-3-cyclohexene-1-carboxylic-acid synthase [Aquibacillus koreensis]|uniref:2-succinyl-5-enolpyruvyl-6-hydroxy-3-cyclohexene-1-carboxylate synthase n=1 Tax=Aquibacillus koreensis TaxID=279446 RepID=A0A9X4AHN7_9BACI|nr:2-succinyl-5-enolpyruvyl-6-hydroxy-3-cyclohexene-1-carboxylic-acid synthase [Aquibacillus koreensis]MCT2535851.1 2-succinyl-5-enolpyruvyl-6-hydroxy-3-cyclohexene-1-carboxylic-acid synthase [Aquibacillus koreensis]MDC3420307.1 2-succinyl-5-enolpyruvyl-6-hydroxy-3-cyclohexene-1-carboxylic-acid synthase [Aquibacillus koreensis]
MNHKEILTRYVANFVDELYQSGLRDVVISPGSRSTPLAMTFAEHDSIHHWVNMDERSAAFFALGMAKQEKRPVALVCTSGTAAANYYPAIIEAYYSRVPLLILTADRPHELRDVGAPQAINQIHLYGNYVKWFHEMALPDGSDKQFSYVRNKASRAFHTAQQANAGPIHMNFPLREPLVPDFSLPNLWGEKNNGAYQVSIEGTQVIGKQQVQSLIAQLSQHKRGLIVCGPQEDTSLAKAVVQLAESWNIPILADPLSQLRAGDHRKAHIIEGYDAILKSKNIREKLQPDFIIRFGAMPISKPYLLYLQENKEIDHFIVESKQGYREPTGERVQFIYADPHQLCTVLAKETVTYESPWMETWTEMNNVTKSILTEEDELLTEGIVAKELIDMVPDSSTVYVGNSMPVRDLDTFFMTLDKKIIALGNRGANGIDGITSSALGAAANGNQVSLLIGDLSFFHDTNALLMAKQYQINLTIVLVNNNGGGIFSFLPQANENSEHFEVLFGTPLHIDFKHVINMYGAQYHQPMNLDAYRQSLMDSYAYKGLSVIEVLTDRSENVRWHKQKWQRIEEHLSKIFLKG